MGQLSKLLHEHVLFWQRCYMYLLVMELNFVWMCMGLHLIPYFTALLDIVT